MVKKVIIAYLQSLMPLHLQAVQQIHLYAYCKSTSLFPLPSHGCYKNTTILALLNFSSVLEYVI